ncbi:MAG TPA: UDP-glucose/GDP-mannose dehydrogenase family protein [Devosia sp.]|nr:UDP-glucose/GDP-mannose dehydrogenase family protein [Devosia sp.]
MKIAIIGSGYVGLVSGACLADFGHEVTCIDINAERIEKLRAGEIPIYEPGLDELVARNTRFKRLSFSTELEGPVHDAEAVFIAVGTPSRRGDGHADLTYVYRAVRDVAAALNPDRLTVVVDKSTVPVGTGDEVEWIIREERPGVPFAVVSNPEFLREGAAIADFKRPDRIVVGVEDDEDAREIMREVYRPLFLNETPILFTRRRTAELIKYAGNAFLAMKITFINEIADLCERLDADVQDVALGIGLDGRIGKKFLHAGPGYGGSCFPKDTLALIKTAQDHESPVRLIETTVAINDQRKRAMSRKVVQAAGGDLRGKTVAVLGLTFKPNTDDMRDSPAISLIQGLQDAGALVRGFDPEGMEEALKVIDGVEYCTDAYETVGGADVAVIVTEWDQFRALDFDRMGKAMRDPVLVDLRNIYTRADVEARGFRYVDVGRGRQTPPPAMVRENVLRLRA